MVNERMDENQYRNNRQCRLRLAPDPRDEGELAVEASIPEHVLARLCNLAHARGLPLLSRLTDHTEVSYPQVQFASIEDELELLFSLVSDRSLLEAVRPLQELIRKGIQNPKGWMLLVEWSE